MREIKFRVWNGMNLEYDVMTGRFGTFYANPGQAGDGLDPKDSASLTPFNTVYSKTTPVMQFTGVTDIKGRDIYEGDIVRTINDALAAKHETMVVNYAGAGFILTNPKCCSSCGSGFAGICPLDEFGGLEVVGNVHENPELLTEREAGE